MEKRSHCGPNLHQRRGCDLTEMHAEWVDEKYATVGFAIIFFANYFTSQNQRWMEPCPRSNRVSLAMVTRNALEQDRVSTFSIQIYE
jgi:hypothetical protein